MSCRWSCSGSCRPPSLSRQPTALPSGRSTSSRFRSKPVLSPTNGSVRSILTALVLSGDSTLPALSRAWNETVVVPSVVMLNGAEYVAEPAVSAPALEKLIVSIPLRVGGAQGHLYRLRVVPAGAVRDRT